MDDRPSEIELANDQKAVMFFCKELFAVGKRGITPSKSAYKLRLAVIDQIVSLFVYKYAQWSFAEDAIQFVQNYLWHAKITGYFFLYFPEKVLFEGHIIETSSYLKTKSMDGYAKTLIIFREFSKEIENEAGYQTRIDEFIENIFTR